MRLEGHEARTRLRTHDHGILGTTRPGGGPHLVPVVYAMLDDHVGVPIDRVKPKARTRLQREDNLAADPRGALLVEHWDADDWSRLWWVRADLEHVADPPAQLVDDLADRLARTVPQYADQPFDRVLVCRIVTITGWAASEAPSRSGTGGSSKA